MICGDRNLPSEDDKYKHLKELILPELLFAAPHLHYGDGRRYAAKSFIELENFVSHTNIQKKNC